MLAGVLHCWSAGFIAKRLICALLVFSMGPGLAFHALSDLAHADAHEHQYEFTAPTAIDHVGGTCSFEHEHDESHAASVSVACLNAPGASVDLAFHAEAIHFPYHQQSKPNGALLGELSKPPRTFSRI